MLIQVVIGKFNEAKDDRRTTAADIGIVKTQADASSVSTFCPLCIRLLQLDLKNLAVEYIIIFLSLLSFS
ncbi:MAG: hypothetical protein ABI688_00970 [Bacteroidota bacterium]